MTGKKGFPSVILFFGQNNLRLTTYSVEHDRRCRKNKHWCKHPKWHRATCYRKLNLTDTVGFQEVCPVANVFKPLALTVYRTLDSVLTNGVTTVKANSNGVNKRNSRLFRNLPYVLHLISFALKESDWHQEKHLGFSDIPYLGREIWSLENTIGRLHLSIHTGYWLGNNLAPLLI